jgi:hypothetical protein
LFVPQEHLFKYAAYMPQAQAVPGEEQGGIAVFGKSHLFHAGLREAQSHIKIRLFQTKGEPGTEPVVKKREEFLSAFVVSGSLAGGYEEALCHAVHKGGEFFLDVRVLFQSLDIVDKDGGTGEQGFVSLFRRAAEQ